MLVSQFECTLPLATSPWVLTSVDGPDPSIVYQYTTPSDDPRYKLFPCCQFHLAGHVPYPSTQRNTTLPFASTSSADLALAIA